MQKKQSIDNGLDIKYSLLNYTDCISSEFIIYSQINNESHHKWKFCLYCTLQYNIRDTNTDVDRLHMTEQWVCWGGGGGIIELCTLQKSVLK